MRIDGINVADKKEIRLVVSVGTELPTSCEEGSIFFVNEGEGIGLYIFTDTWLKISEPLPQAFLVSGDVTGAISASSATLMLSPAVTQRIKSLEDRLSALETLNSN